MAIGNSPAYASASMLFLAISFTTVQHWITTRGFYGGCAAVFLLLFACGVGLPLPEDIPLIISGAFLIPKGSGVNTWIIVGSACWCGIIGGDLILYYLGRRFGQNVTQLPIIGKHVTRERLDSVQKLFEKYGVGVVGIGRLFAGIRGAMVLCAGTIRFNFLKFIIADGIAAIISGGLFILLGHWLGTNLNEETIARYKHKIAIGAVILAVGFVVWILWTRRHREGIRDAEEKVVAKVAGTEKKIEKKIVETLKRTPPPVDDPAARA